MLITAQAPTRIDLAGGTLDLWPLPCFFPGAMTVNAAIDLHACVSIEERKDKKIHIHSQDTGVSLHVSRFQDLEKATGLDLVRKIIDFYSPNQGFNLITRCEAPMGSGIAGSSALNIALNGALNAFTGSRYTKKDILEIAKNLEASVLGVPAGVQDYYPALYGGLNALHFRPQGTERENMDSFLPLVEETSLLCYTGLSRFSGANNWEILKGTIDGNKKIYRELNGIKIAVEELRDSLKKRDGEGIAAAIEKEWESRKRLARGVSHPGIEKLIRSVKKLGKVSAKICGAGGGGCLYIFILEGDRREMESALERAGGKIIPFRFVRKGLTVSTEKK